MGDGLRTIRLVSHDESLRQSTSLAAEALEGWEFAAVEAVEDLMRRAPAPGDVVLLDKWVGGGNIYELIRDLAGRTRCRLFVVANHDDTGDTIARFCGAMGSIARPVSKSKLEVSLSEGTGPRPPLPSERRGADDGVVLPERLLTDISGRPDQNLVGALTDPQTSLFNYAFLNYKLDEEFKRAKRFRQPLACVMLGFEGNADSDTLARLAGIFLLASRDTDILGRFDENSFLFLLPQTGPEGAGIMARRVREEAEREGLKDLVGDTMQLSVGIAAFPNEAIQRREDLYAQARQAFLEARSRGGGVVRI